MFAQPPACFLAALEVARHQNQKQIRKLPSQSQENFSEQDFLAIVSAAADQQPRAGSNADLFQHLGHVEQTALLKLGGVKFQIADDMNRLFPAAEFAKT